MEELVNLLEEAEALRGKPGWTNEDEAFYEGLVKKFEQVEGLSKRGIPAEEAFESVKGRSPFQSEQAESKEFDQMLQEYKDSELERLWEGLSEEEKAEYRSIGGNAAAATMSALDNVLPVPAITWAIGLFNPHLEREIKRAKAANKGAASVGEWAGTVTGLIGGPLALAKAIRSGAKFLKNRALKASGHASSKALTKWEEEARKLVSEFKSKGIYGGGEVPKKIADTIMKEIDEVDDLLRDWYNHIYEQKMSTPQIREFLTNRVNNLPDNHVIKKVAGGDDLMYTLWDLQPASSKAPTGTIDRIKKALAHRAKSIALNTVPEGIEFSVALAGDAGANFTYSYNDWLEQGFPRDEAFTLAIRYTLDRAPHDVVIEALDTFFGGGVGTSIVQTLLRTWSIAPDLDAKTGKVRPDVYEEEPQNLRDGGMVKPLIYRNEGGGGSADRFPGLKRIQQGLIHLGIDSPGIDRVRTGLENLPSARTVAELTPVLGDALAAEEVYKELQKDPINWTMVGILGGATLIGVVPGIGDAAAKAIKAGASAAARGTKAATNALADLDLEVDPNTLGSNLGNIKIVKKGGRPKKIETFHIRDNTGFTTTFTGTQEQFSKKYGVSASSAKTKGGRLKDKSMQWNKSGEFKEFKSGAAKQQPERFDPEDIDFDYDKRASIPRSLDPELLDQLEDMVDEPLERHMNEFLDELEEARGGTLSGFWETERNALDIADRAWPEIAKELRQSNMINALDPETYNKVVQWAKNRTKRVFDVEDISKDVNTGAGKGSGYIEFDDFDPDDLGINDGIWEDVTPRNITITQPGVERRRVMKGRDQKWDHTASDVSISKMIKSKEVSPDDAKKIYSNLKLDGMIDKYGNWTDKAVKEHGAVQKKRPEFIDNKQGDINTLNNWAKKLKDPRGEMADINAKLKTNKSEMEHLQDKPLTKREVQNLERQRTAIEDLLGLENTPTTWDIPVTAEEIAAFRADLKRVMGPKPGGIIDTHFNKGGRVRRGVIPLIYN